MLSRIVVVILVVGMAVLLGFSEAQAPSYTEDGSLVRPKGYEEWMHVGTSLGLGYSEDKPKAGPGSFQNVYIQREAYQHYKRTGRFPEKTMLALAIHEPRQKESIGKRGFFQGDLTALEVAVKDTSRFPEGWAYFDFGRDAETAKAFPNDKCFNCHHQNAGDDNVFVQFYPRLRGSGQP